ncbi:MAG: NAD-dependent epimerase/dehydratase family protein [Planctomycetota bacterium]
MRVLVTGCGGFLGSEVVRQLLRRGDEVVGVSRREYPELASKGMTSRQADLSDLKSARAVIRDVDAVIHTAAVAGVWGPWSYFYRNNLLATENVVRACREQRISTLVFTSSPSVTFDGGDQTGVDESVGYPDRWLCHYPRTKALAEQRVLEANGPELRTCALRPHLIWGVGDPHLLPRVLDRAKSGRLRIVGRGSNRVDTVHVVNAAAAHLDALDHLCEAGDVASGEASLPSAAGKAYFIAQDEPVDCWDWIGEICQIGGVPAPKRRISFAAAYAIGTMLEAVWWAGRRRDEPPMTRFVAAQLAKDHYFDISAAKRDFGYRVRVDMQQGLKELSEEWRS